ncbi:MAG: pyridoxamine 5'-phosphate oxidase family protein [Bacilli bacterium]|nr:pyridoxamine 5'-phosphate oxidase family protein [Bacilli bacterium]
MALVTSKDNMTYVRVINAYFEDGSFSVITYGLSSKMKHIKANLNVSLCGEWLTAYGTSINLGYFVKNSNKNITDKLRSAFSNRIDNGHNNFQDENTIILQIKLTIGEHFSHGTRYDIDFTK